MRKRTSIWREILHTLVVTGGMFLFLESFVLQGFSVHGCCMEPNLYTGERLLGNKFLYRIHPPRRGDVVVFRFPGDPRRIYVKRVIALPGETVEIREGDLFVNGMPLDETYVRNPAHGDYPLTRVPDGHYFVLGDNRDHSSDSRFWGFLPSSHLEGKVWLRYWPPQRAGRVLDGGASPEVRERR